MSSVQESLRPGLCRRRPVHHPSPMSTPPSRASARLASATVFNWIPKFNASDPEAVQATVVWLEAGWSGCVRGGDLPVHSGDSAARFSDGARPNEVIVTGDFDGSLAMPPGRASRTGSFRQRRRTRRGAAPAEVTVRMASLRYPGGAGRLVAEDDDLACDDSGCNSVGQPKTQQQPLPQTARSAE